MVIESMSMGGIYLKVCKVEEEDRNWPARSRRYWVGREGSADNASVEWRIHQCVGYMSNWVCSWANISVWQNCQIQAVSLSLLAWKRSPKWESRRICFIPKAKEMFHRRQNCVPSLHSRSKLLLPMLVPKHRFLSSISTSPSAVEQMLHVWWWPTSDQSLSKNPKTQLKNVIENSKEWLRGYPLELKD